MPPASGSSNSTTNAAVQAAAKAEREEKLRGALKTFIIKEKQRKKEELEASLEEIRQRKEREERERENETTIEETRWQITKMEQKLTELRNQKEQLMQQLKKVVDDDENRKKQQQDSEMFAMQQAAPPQPQVFLTPVRVHQQMPLITKPPNNPPVKRGRSPSPTQQSYYKQTNYNPPKHDEGRRSAESARTLWNKPHTQYQAPPGTLFYQTTSNGPPQQPPPDARGPAIIYTHYNLPLRQNYHMELQPASGVSVSKNDVQGQKPTQVYHINLDQPPISQAGGSGLNTVQSQKPQVTMEKLPDRYHAEVKHDGPPSHVGPPTHQIPEGAVYIPNLPLHANVMQISGPPPQHFQSSKSVASITQGYAPGRNAPGHESQLSRQPQITVMPGQPGQQSQQQLHYPRRMF